MTMLAATEWPEASIAVAGALGAFALVSVIVWQVFATGRAAMSVRREQEYRRVAEDATEAQTTTARLLEEAVSELRDLRVRTGELERMLKEVA